MKGYINDLLANLEEARDDLTPRVADGECEPLTACMEKINAVYTAVLYWEQVNDNGGLEHCEGAAAFVDTLFMETISENLDEAAASALAYVDYTNWKDSRACDAYAALEEADAIANTYMKREV